MNEDYKGYRITPNSSELPNGKWLPVAELEIHSGERVIVKPTVRAPDEHAKATKEEADQYALLMAQKWIDERG